MKPTPTTKASKKMKAADTLPVEAQALSSAWVPFVHRLAQALEKLLEDQYLIITKKGTNEFIQFASQGFYGLRVETISNHYRDEANQLSDVQIANLLDIGWSAPTNNPDKSTPAADPDGSPNFFAEFPLPLYVIEIAQMAVKTFTEVLNLNHPAFLEYEAFSSDGNSLPIPQLGLKLAIRSEKSAKNSALPKLVMDTVKELTGIDDLSYDEDGDLGGIRFKSIVTYVRLIADRPYIRLFAILLNNVEPTLQLLALINRLNAQEGFLHLIHKDGAVIAISDVLVTPFVASHIAHALGNFTQIADEMFVTLQSEFGGGASSSVQSLSQLKH